MLPVLIAMLRVQVEREFDEPLGLPVPKYLIPSSLVPILCMWIDLLNVCRDDSERLHVSDLIAFLRLLHRQTRP